MIFIHSFWWKIVMFISTLMCLLYLLGFVTCMTQKHTVNI